MSGYFKLSLISFAILFLFGCRKFDFHRPDSAKNCRIEMMTGLLNNSEVLHRKFNYNESGNPETVEYVETEGGTGTPNFYFWYNDKQQLIRCLGYSHHIFTYNSKGQVVTDSIHVFYTGGDARYEDKYYYDVYGRVSKVVNTYYYDIFPNDEVGTVITSHYKYDSRGNLVIPGVTYDNKTSIYRTHPIWMFLHRNYSINNAVKATSYNSAGLPLTFENYISFLESSITVQTVEYDCSDGAK